MPTINSKWEDVRSENLQIGDIIKPSKRMSDYLKTVKAFESCLPNLLKPCKIIDIELDGDAFIVRIDVKDSFGYDIGFEFSISRLLNITVENAYRRRRKNASN